MFVQLPFRPRRLPRNPSSRVRKRRRMSMAVWRGAAKMTLMLNGMDRGHSGVSTETLHEARSTSEREATPAVVSLHRFLLQESARLERWRGGPSGRIGVRALSWLLQSPPSIGYAPGGRGHAPRATLCAEAIDEPLACISVGLFAPTGCIRPDQRVSQTTGVQHRPAAARPTDHGDRLASDKLIPGVGPVLLMPS